MRIVRFLLPVLVLALGIAQLDSCHIEMEEDSDFWQDMGIKEKEKGGSDQGCYTADGKAFSAGEIRYYTLESFSDLSYALGVMADGIDITVSKDSAYSDIVVQHQGKSPEVFRGTDGILYIRVRNTGNSSVTESLQLAYTGDITRILETFKKVNSE